MARDKPEATAKDEQPMTFACDSGVFGTLFLPIRLIRVIRGSLSAFSGLSDSAGGERLVHGAHREVERAKVLPGVVERQSVFFDRAHELRHRSVESAGEPASLKLRLEPAVASVNGDGLV